MWVCLLAAAAVFTGVRIALAQQAVSLQANMQAAQPPPAPSLRYGQTVPLPSEQRFVRSQAGLLPSQQRDLSFRSGPLPSQGTIAPPPGAASVRYAGYTQQYNRVANNIAPSSVRYGGNLNASRSYGTSPQVHTVAPAAASPAPTPAGSTQVASGRITNYRPWTPSPDRSRPVYPNPNPRSDTPSVRYSPASLGQFTPTPR